MATVIYDTLGNFFNFLFKKNYELDDGKNVYNHKFGNEKGANFNDRRKWSLYELLLNGNRRS